MGQTTQALISSQGATHHPSSRGIKRGDLSPKPNLIKVKIFKRLILLLAQDKLRFMKEERLSQKQ